jgi:hypothetical protein
MGRIHPVLMQLVVVARAGGGGSLFKMIQQTTQHCTCLVVVTRGGWGGGRSNSLFNSIQYLSIWTLHRNANREPGDVLQYCDGIYSAKW